MIRGIILLLAGVMVGVILSLYALVPPRNRMEAGGPGETAAPPQQPGTLLSFEKERADFVRFLHRFSTDTSFQMEHVSWPLERHGLSTEYDIETTYVDKKEWRFAKVAYCCDYMPLLFSGFDQTFVNSGERIVSWHGKETGESFWYFFKKEKGAWRLVRYDDFSG